VATEAAWLNGNNLEKEETNEAEREKKRNDERKVLTLTGLLMEGAKPKGRRYDAGARVPPAICALLGAILVGVKSGLVPLPRYFPA
jgi:hypothetical protein